MKLLKALIIDQNILVRRIIAKVIYNYKDFSTYCITDDYDNAEKLIHERSPDVVLLGIDSITSPGNTLLHTLQSRYPRLPIVVVTPKSKEGAEAAINALRSGALDFITRPEHKNLVMFAEHHFEKRLKPVLQAATRSAVSQKQLNSLIKPKKTLSRLKKRSPAKVITIAGGTGGVQALFTILATLPENLEAPVVMVQHMPRIYTEKLASKLDAVSDLTVREASRRVAIKGGEVWLAPGGYQCEIGDSDHKPVLNVQREPRVNDRRPSADLLFQSAARKFGKETLAVLISGSADDGMMGAGEVKNRGGEVIVQDPRTAITPDLPLALLKKDWAGGYYFPEELADQVVKRTSQIPSMPVVSNGLDDETKGKGDGIIFM